MSIGLEFGELNTAAQTVADSIGPLDEMLTALSDSIAASATGFKGQAASGLGEAIGAWFDIAATLGPTLQSYAHGARHHLRRARGQRGRAGLVVHRPRRTPRRWPVSDRGLVVRQGSLSEMEEAMSTATSSITDHLTTHPRRGQHADRRVDRGDAVAPGPARLRAPAARGHHPAHPGPRRHQGRRRDVPRRRAGDRGRERRDRRLSAPGPGSAFPIRARRFRATMGDDVADPQTSRGHRGLGGPDRLDRGRSAVRAVRRHHRLSRRGHARRPSVGQTRSPWCARTATPRCALATSSPVWTAAPSPCG